MAKEHALRCEVVSCSHAHRDANKVAHHLASMANPIACPCFWLGEVPDEVSSYVTHDSIAVS